MLKADTPILQNNFHTWL